MADDYTSSVRISSLIYAEYIETAILEALGARATVAPLVANYDARGKNTKTYSIAAYPALTISTVGETADLSTAAFVPTDGTVTPTEYGWMTVLPDLARETTMDQNLANGIASAATRGIERAVDTTITALFPNLNGDTTTGAGATCSASVFLGAIALLEQNDVQTDMAAVLHPEQTEELRLDLVNTQAVAYNADLFGVRKAQPNGYCGNYFGVDIYQTTGVGTTNGATADKAGALMAIGDMWSPIALVTWRPVRVEPERNASLRADELVISSVFGAAERSGRDAAGICIQTQT